MPMTEVSMTSGGTMNPVAIPADDTEVLFDAGPFDSGRFDVPLKMTEEAISAQ